jgi:hypothetical protein
MSYCCVTGRHICSVACWCSYIFVFCFLEQVKVPETSDSVEYVSQTAAVVIPTKRGKKLKEDVPMEERLDNLSLTKQDTGSREPPRSDSMAHLLMQVCMPRQIFPKPPVSPKHSEHRGRHEYVRKSRRSEM